MDSAPTGKRRSNRHQCSLPVELRPVGQAYPTQSETSDISEFGCYVKSLFPWPPGTAIGMRIAFNGTEILAKGVVKTADQGVGNGIEFVEFIADGKHQLHEYLASLGDPDPEPSSTVIP